jgi:hypothetical protein
MGQLVFLGFGAGLVSALLFGAVAAGSPAGMVLSYLAPLPILIVALGWHHLVGLLGVAIGALATSFVLRSSAGLAFALGPALPAWWLAFLVLSARVTTGPAAAVEWMSTGRLLAWTGVTGACIAFAAALGLGGGDYGQFAEILRRATDTLLRSELGMPRQGPAGTIGGVPGETLVRLLILVTPMVAAAVFSLTLALNLWLGAKVVAMSGRLPRPWPAIPDTRMPTHALILLSAGILAGLTSGWLGVAGRALAGGLAMMFALQGLALIHIATREKQGRVALLALTYLFTVLLGHIVLPFLAVAGMIDTATPFRRRLTRNETPRGRNGPPSST